jgi:transposase
MCGAIHTEMTMKKAFRDTMVCACGNHMGRDRNAAVNHYRYCKECENRSGDAPTRVEIGVQGSPRCRPLKRECWLAWQMTTEVGNSELEI